jgi:hypothetical protein
MINLYLKYGLYSTLNKLSEKDMSIEEKQFKLISSKENLYCFNFYKIQI